MLLIIIKLTVNSHVKPIISVMCNFITTRLTTIWKNIISNFVCLQEVFDPDDDVLGGTRVGKTNSKEKS